MRIVYGLPNERMFEDANEGKITIGGCIMSGDDPEQVCNRCGASVFPDGRFLVTDQDRRWMAVSLPVASGPDIEVSLQAELAQDGTLRLAGQDVGPGVERIWGDLDYEYWLTVEPEHLPRVIALLIRERLSDLEDFGRLLDDYAALQREGSMGGLGSYSPGSSPDDYIEIYLDQPEPIAVEPKVVLYLLQDLYRAETFTGTSDLRSWLEERGIPSQFFSYA